MRGRGEQTDQGPWRLVHVVRRRLPARRLRIVAAVIVALALIAFGLLWATPLFAVKDVEVTGTEVLDSEQVAAAADEYLDRSMLRADLAEIADEVAAHPAVKAVDVSRAWPRVVLIEVVERDPYLAVPSGEETFLIADSEGVVFDEVEDVADAIWDVELDAPAPDDLATIEVLEVLQALPSSLSDEVDRVEASTPAAVTLILDDGRTLRWGDGSQSDKKSRVADRLLAGGYEHVDVSAPDAPTVS